MRLGAYPDCMPRHMRRHGFTLIEMLVAVAVLAILIVLVAQVLNSATSTSAMSEQRLDADNQARLVFSQMDIDFGGMIKRKDLDYLFAKVPSGNDVMFFYSEAPGFFDQKNSDAHTRSPLTLVGYRINSQYSLERVGTGLTWDGAPDRGTGGVTFLANKTGSGPSEVDPESTLSSLWTSQIGTPPSYTDGSENHAHVIADGVFRMEFCFLTKDGKFLAPQNATDIRRVASDVSAIVVTIAILDSKSKVIVPDLKAAAAALVDGDEPSVSSSWTSLVNSGNPLGIKARSARSNIRIYQRFFYISPI